MQNDRGETVTLPRPLCAARIWSVTEREYEAIDIRLDGAPSEEETDAWWQQFIANMKETRGEDLIDSLLGVDSSVAS